MITTCSSSPDRRLGWHLFTRRVATLGGGAVAAVALVLPPHSPRHGVERQQPRPDVLRQVALDHLLHLASLRANVVEFHSGSTAASSVAKISCCSGSSITSTLGRAGCVAA